MNIILTIKAEREVPFHYAVNDAMRIANTLNVTVKLKGFGVAVFIEPNDDKVRILEQYWKKMRAKYGTDKQEALV